MFTRQFLKVNLRSNHTWTLPEGYKTPVNVYNCVTKRNEPLVLKNKDAVTWYTCGPTVYDSAHIGHGCCYVKLDNIQRILKRHFGLNLITCMNITDVDDKIIAKARKLGLDYREVARTYEKEFWRDLTDLNVIKPDVVLRVTDNMPLIIKFIEKLECEDYAYKAADNSVYFDQLKNPHPSGKLQNISDGYSDSDNLFKRAPNDFALWKSLKNNNEPSFDSPWGPGRPGWHIECSTLASYVFGNNIDIHAGGLDLRFPHHENEEIQSCAFHNRGQWVNYWLHTGHLHLKDSVKMSKSLKNTIKVQEMLLENHVDVFRLACAMSHYSTPMEFSSELMDTAANTLKVYKNFFVNCSEVIRGIIEPSLNNEVLHKLLISAANSIEEAYCDNFNTPQVIHVINQVITNVNTMLHSTASSRNETTFYLLALQNLVNKTLNDFGVMLNEHRDNINVEDDTELIETLVEFRQEVRKIGLSDKNKDLLKLCDSVRDSMRKSGVNVKDHGNISSWSR